MRSDPQGQVLQAGGNSTCNALPQHISKAPIWPSCRNPIGWPSVAHWLFVRRPPCSIFPAPDRLRPAARSPRSHVSVHFVGSLRPCKQALGPMADHSNPRPTSCLVGLAATTEPTHPTRVCISAVTTISYPGYLGRYVTIRAYDTLGVWPGYS